MSSFLSTLWSEISSFFLFIQNHWKSVFNAPKIQWLLEWILVFTILAVLLFVPYAFTIFCSLVFLSLLWCIIAREKISEHKFWPKLPPKEKTYILRPKPKLPDKPMEADI